MQVETLAAERAEAYDAYLLRHAGSLLYYSSKYKRLLERLLGCEDHSLVATEHGQIVGILPLMSLSRDGRQVYNSLPYYGSNGGILAENEAARVALVGAYNSIAAGPSVASSTIVSNPFVEQNPAGIAHNYTDFRIAQFTDLRAQSDPTEALLSRIDKSAKRNVAKARRERVSVDIDHGQLGPLRELHQANMREIGGRAKTDAFFQLVPECFDPETDYDVFVARWGDQIVAALLVFYFNQTVEYYTPAVASEHRTLQASSLVLITAMAHASRRGFRWWNWGGTWASQTGVYRFKKKWGAEERRYEYYTQLNDQGILGWDQANILAEYPSFFVIPFSQLQSGGEA